MKTKTCFKCNKEQDLAEFYKHKEMADGHLGKCKTCAKKDSINARNKNIEFYRAYDRKRGNRQGSSYCKEYRKNNVEKYKACMKVQHAIRAGKLIRGLCCEKCGSEKYIHGHHTDYNKPLQVQWLCSACHARLHKGILLVWRGDSG